jgi:Zn ribbon nucleic-acid-binding protein
MNQAQITEPKAETVERQCPKCHQWNRITITEYREDGLEIWHCHGCGKAKEYRVN